MGESSGRCVSWFCCIAWEGTKGRHGYGDFWLYSGVDTACIASACQRDYSSAQEPKKDTAA